MQKIFLFVSFFITSLSIAQTNGFELIQDVQEFKNGENLSYQMIWKIAEQKSVLEIDYIGTGESNLVLLSKNNQLYVYSKKQADGANHYYKSIAKNDVETPLVFSSQNHTIINGYNAKEFIMKSATKEISFWFTEDIDVDFSAFAQILEAVDFKGLSEKLPSKGAILEYTVKENGNVTSKVNFKTFNSSSFKPSVFEFPSGYTLFTK